MTLGRLPALLALGLTGIAWGQQAPVRLVLTQGQNSQNIASGAALSFNAAIGESAVARVRVIYTGVGELTVSQAPLILGSGFTAAIDGSLPLTAAAGGAFEFEIVFSPTSVQSNAQLTLPITETLPPAAGSTNPIVNSFQVTLELQGLAPSFIFSYVLQTDENVVPVPPGGEIPFAPTRVGTTAQAAVNITNAGTGLGVVTAIGYTGNESFRLQRRPLLPATVGSNQNIQVLLLYSPSDAIPAAGQITIGFASGPDVILNVTATGIAPQLIYQVLTTNPPTAVEPGGTIQLPGTDVGQTSSVAIRILNQGTASGTINTINVVGQGFVLGSVLTLPKTLEPDGSMVLEINFTPARPGALTGSLIVNADIFSLSGTGLGSLLTFSYMAGGSTITLGGTNNTVVFSPVTISQSADLVLTVKNTGSVAAPVSSIVVSPANGPYSLNGIPALPLSLAPNGSFQIAIRFRPTTLGLSTGTLLVDTANIGLAGSATDPPPLPAYTIEGPSGRVEPLTQPSIRLRLSSPYPVAIAGVLSIGIASGNLPADPAVQFATGGASVAFLIPANQTDAVFGTQGPQIGLQSGTVASTITLTPAFATQAGNIELTPAAPASLQFSVSAAPPSLIAVQVVNPAASSFTVQVTGFTTSRSLTQATVEFTLAKGFSMPVSSFTIDLSQVSAVWFQSTASQPFGGQFRMTLPFAFQGLGADQSVLKGISAVSVTMSNAAGQSSPIQAILQ